AVEYRLEDSEAVACIVDGSNVEAVREARDGLPGIETVLTVDAEPAGDERDLWEAIEGRSPTFETVETAAEDDAIVIYTSGTTGEPKGVRHAHRVLLGHLPLFVTTFCNMAIDEDERREPRPPLAENPHGGESIDGTAGVIVHQSIGRDQRRRVGGSRLRERDREIRTRPFERRSHRFCRRIRREIQQVHRLSEGRIT
ncbi:MAG: AMP-binding protein, partial [Halalkalicoccus sp.]